TGREAEAIELYIRAGSRSAAARASAAIGREAEAIALLRTELSAAGGLPPQEQARLHREVGELERRVGRSADAARSLEAALALEPSDHATARQLAGLLRTLGDVRRAEGTLRALAGRLPPGAERADALVELGELRLSLGDAQGALAAL